MPYLPALRFDALAWAYEPIAMRLCRASSWRPAIIDAVAPQPGQRILDLGCGPGTLGRLLEQRCPDAVVVGVDPDPVMLDRAREANLKHGSRMALVEASGTALPEEAPLDTPFDVCVSSLMFHHLKPEQKQAALGEALRVLVPNGRLVITDWGPPKTPGGYLAFNVTQLFDGFTTTRDHASGSFAAMLEAVGLRERARWATPVGTMCLYHGTEPAPADAATNARISAAT